MFSVKRFEGDPHRRVRFINRGVYVHAHPPHGRMAHGVFTVSSGGWRQALAPQPQSYDMMDDVSTVGTESTKPREEVPTMTLDEYEERFGHHEHARSYVDFVRNRMMKKEEDDEQPFVSEPTKMEMKPDDDDGYYDEEEEGSVKVEDNLYEEEEQAVVSGALSEFQSQLSSGTADLFSDMTIQSLGYESTDDWVRQYVTGL